MPSTIVTTVQASTSNSYVTVAAARTYFDDRLHGQTFREASEDDQTRALIQAASRLNDVYWNGSRVISTQALAWPRYGVIKRDGVGFGSSDNYALASPRSGYGIYGSGIGEFFDSTTIPQFVKDAQCELALAYLEGFADGGGSRMTKVSQDGLAYEKEYAQPLGALPERVVRLISPYIQGSVKVRA